MPLRRREIALAGAGLTAAAAVPTAASAQAQGQPQASGAPGAPAPLTPDEARATGRLAFLWGMHPVAIYHLRHSIAQNERSPNYVGLGRLRWEREPKKADRLATTPNATTQYGVGFFDLRRDPVVVTVPEIRDRYWSVQLHDNYAR